MRYFIPLLTLLIPLLLSAQDGEFDAYYPENKLYRELGVKEIRRATHYGTPDTSIYVTTFDSLGRITSEKTGNSHRTTYFVYEQHSDTLIRIGYFSSNEKNDADTFRIELFIYNEKGVITDYFHFSNMHHIEYQVGSNCTNGHELSHLKSTFYNENFYYNEQGECIYKHHSINKWIDIPFQVTTKLPNETLVFNNTYEYQYNKKGNMITKTAIAGDEILGFVDSFFYENNKFVKQAKYIKKHPLSNKDLIETTYTNTIENGLHVTTLVEVASNRYMDKSQDNTDVRIVIYKYYYNTNGLLVRSEIIQGKSILVREFEYGFY